MLLSAKTCGRDNIISATNFHCAQIAQKLVALGDWILFKCLRLDGFLRHAFGSHKRRGMSDATSR